jgi:hypothetical protein
VPPSNPPKLHLNEHLSPRLASQLRRYGFDVTSSQETELLSDDDSAQLAHSASQQRAILTFNSADFVALHEQYMVDGKEHWGIVLSFHGRTYQSSHAPIVETAQLRLRRRPQESNSLAQ